MTIGGAVGPLHDDIARGINGCGTRAGPFGERERIYLALQRRKVQAGGILAVVTQPEPRIQLLGIMAVKGDEKAKVSGMKIGDNGCATGHGTMLGQGTQRATHYRTIGPVCRRHASAPTLSRLLQRHAPAQED